MSAARSSSSRHRLPGRRVWSGCFSPTSAPARRSRDTGFSFNAHFQFEINTTGTTQYVAGFVPEVVNSTYTGNVIQEPNIPIGAGVMLEVGGSLTLVNLITIAGDFDVTIAPTFLDVTMYAARLRRAGAQRQRRQRGGSGDFRDLRQRQPGGRGYRHGPPALL